MCGEYMNWVEGSRPSWLPSLEEVPPSPRLFPAITTMADPLAVPVPRRYC